MGILIQGTCNTRQCTSHTGADEAGLRSVDARGGAACEAHSALECPLAPRQAPHACVHAREFLVRLHGVLKRAVLLGHNAILFSLRARSETQKRETKVTKSVYLNQSHGEDSSKTYVHTVKLYCTSMYNACTLYNIRSMCLKGGMERQQRERTPQRKGKCTWLKSKIESR